MIPGCLETEPAAAVRAQVLVIDDMLPAALLVAARIGRIEGVEAIPFESPIKALAWCRQQVPDLIIVDYRMPEMDGIDFIKAFRTLAADEFVPIIVLTAETDRSVLYAALDAGATDFLRKPFDEVELIARGRTMLQLRQYNRMLCMANQELERLATTDPLTGALNRRAFLTAAENEITRTRRFGGPMCVLMIDLDHFKQINDSYGHAGGDQALRQFVSGVLSLIRGTDRLGRIGGEEFAVLLPQTDTDHALILAERIRSGPWQVAWPACNPGSFTFAVSIGLVDTNAPTTSIEDMLQKADAALYQAKKTGRNRVVRFVADGPEVITNGQDQE
ncbi:two-component system, cell cycle response regulator [uncultured Gammaproteobacteria bacterium]